MTKAMEELLTAAKHQNNVRTAVIQHKERIHIKSGITFCFVILEFNWWWPSKVMWAIF